MDCNCGVRKGQFHKANCEVVLAAFKTKGDDMPKPKQRFTTQHDFDESFNARVIGLQRVLQSKNTEYARGGDKLSNFKKAAGLQGCSQLKACQGMMAKHQVSISDLINDDNAGIKIKRELWDEKITDALNYLFLLDAIYQEEN
jgi:hypothetical protein